ncbi:hypothetical protein ACEOHC_003842, partial [Salmonella enterica]
SKGEDVVRNKPLLGGASIEVEDRVPEFRAQRPVATTATVITDVTSESIINTPKVGGASVEVGKGEDVVRSKALVGGASAEVSKREDVISRQQPVATKTNTVNEAPNEGQLHASRYYGPIHNADSLAHAQELAHDPRYVTSNEGKKAAAIAEKAAATKLAQEKIAEDRAAAQAKDANAPAEKGVFLEANSVIRGELVGHKAAPLQANAPVGARATATPGTPTTTLSTNDIVLKIDTRVGAETTRAQGVEKTLQDNIDKKADQTDVATNTRKLVAVDTQSMEAQQRSIDNKTNITALTTTVGTKADQTALDAVKTDVATTRSNLNTQVVAVEDKLKLKADQTALDAETTRATTAEQDNARGIMDNGVRISNLATDTDNRLSQKAEKQDVTDLTNRVGNDEFDIIRNKDRSEGNRLVIDGNTNRIANAETQLMTKASQAQVDSNTTAIQDETKRATAAEASKVDTTTYDAGQKAQDDKIADNKTAISTKADQTAVDANSKLISDNKTAISTKADQTAVDANSKLISDNKTAISTNAGEIRSIQNLQNTQGAYVQQMDTQVKSNTQTLAKHDKRISKNSADIAQNKRDIQDTRKELKRGLNNAAAMTGLHYKSDNSWALSTGTANGDGAAIAGGLQKGVTEHLNVNVQGSTSMDGGWMASVGLSGDF